MELDTMELDTNFLGYKIHLLHQEDGWKSIVERGSWAKFLDRPFEYPELAMLSAKFYILENC